MIWRGLLYRIGLAPLSDFYPLRDALHASGDVVVQLHTENRALRAENADLKRAAAERLLQDARNGPLPTPTDEWLSAHRSGVRPITMIGFDRADPLSDITVAYVPGFRHPTHDAGEFLRLPEGPPVDHAVDCLEGDKPTLSR